MNILNPNIVNLWKSLFGWKDEKNYYRKTKNEFANSNIIYKK